MAIVHKPNGKLRICIDPQPLNAALKREHYKLPILDDVLPKLKDAKIFSKLDVKEAYWHVRLDESSSKLTTTITPFGRYMWKRLLFGLKVSSEFFQRKLDKALGDLDGRGGREGGRMAEWLGRWISMRWPRVQIPLWVSAWFNSSVILVNSQLVCLPPVGILIMLSLFELFVSLDLSGVPVN